MQDTTDSPGCRSSVLSLSVPVRSGSKEEGTSALSGPPGDLGELRRDGLTVGLLGAARLFGKTEHVR